MKVLLLNWKDPAQRDAGGAERFVQRIAEVWADEGHDVSLFVPRPKRAPRDEVIRGVRYVRAGSRSTVFWHARRYLRRHHCEWDFVVEAVSTRPFLSHRIVGQRSVALYMQMADDVWHREFPLPVAWLGRRVLEPMWLRRMKGARIVPISPSTADDLGRYGLATLPSVPPGSDIDRRERVDAPGRGPFRVIFMGRLCQSKRPFEALEAFRLIQETYPNSTFDIVGDGYLAPALRKHAGANVVVHGYVSEATKIDLLDRAHVMLLPATREGYGIVAIEAGARGVPVVAYDVPGLRDAVTDGVTGILVESQPRHLAEAAIGLLQDQDRWMSISRDAFRASQGASWNSAARRLMIALLHLNPTAPSGKVTAASDAPATALASLPSSNDWAEV